MIALKGWITRIYVTRVSELYSCFVTDYVGKLFQFVMGLNKQQLQHTCSDHKTIISEPRNKMLEKEPRELAIRKQVKRFSIVVKNVPPTTAGTYQNKTLN